MKQISEPSVERISFEEALDKDGVIVFTNVGVSMMPLLRQRRDIIEVRKKGPGRCRKYDVVLYKRGDQYILHRILRVYPDRYLIAGDHCVYVEKDIKDENILGVMTRVKRDRKFITPNNLWYKVYVHLWCDFYPVRMIVLRLKWKLYKLIDRIKALGKHILKI